MAEARTACPLDCPDACSVTATVDAGRVTKLDGDTRNRLTQGFICGKVRRFGAHAYGDARILQPAVRVGKKGSGTFEAVSWDVALDRIATTLLEIRDRSGGEAILPFSYGGSNGALTEGSVDARLFRRLGASELERTVCAAATTAAQDGLYGLMPGVDVNDYVHAELIVLWGFNPSASGIHLVPLIKEARARGAKLVVVDPRVTPLAKSADLHLAVRPGTDLPVALGIIHALFERGHADEAFLGEHATGVDTLRARAAGWSLPDAADVAGLDIADLERFVSMYASSSPAVIRCGWGLERNRNGGSAVASVLALPAVAGKFGPVGGGFTMSHSRTFGWNTDPAVAEPLPDVRHISMNRLGPALLESDPAIEALFVYNANPLATIPDQVRVRQGLEREDLFTVVFEQVHTDTARYADVLLPATTFLEHHDLARGYGASVLNRIRPVADVVGESRPNYAVFAELLERTGLARSSDVVEPNALADAITETIALDPAARDHLRTDGVVDEPPAPRMFVDRVARTDDGKIHLCPAALDDEARAAHGMGLYTFQDDPGTDAHPLALISPASAKTTSSTFGQLLHAPARVDVHPRDAAARNIEQGDRVRVFNELGTVECLANVTTDVRPGVLSLAKGLWCAHTLNGNTSNALCPTTLTDLGRGATFNDARVQLARLN